MTRETVLYSGKDSHSAKTKSLMFAIPHCLRRRDTWK